ncbi:virulence factor SrfC family protein [Reyranella sp.]|uniref:virulence factor SrfC family protein n=1 Tax=Reyranella sp. TaxID=1929291 RepID=UPI003D0E3CFE
MVSTGGPTAVEEAAANEALANRCEAVARAAQDAVDWLAGASDQMNDLKPVLSREFRREAIHARKLAVAARRPMCVSVFGPSQQGKSYLVGSLARRGVESTRITFGGEIRDFVRDLNPAGNKESTGVVTRFTIRPTNGLPGMPVCFRMLSQTDVIKIMANAFMADFDPDSVTPLEDGVIEATLARLRPRAAAGPVGDLSEDDVYDLREYFDRYFRNHVCHTALRGFWDEIESLAPRLPVRDRVELFALLWQSTPTMTLVATAMVEALASLGFPEEAFAPLAAVEPRETSVIDVETMRGLESGAGSKVTVATRAGRRADLPRSVLTAIIAELQLQLADTPFPFFEYTDLLDFPGARSRGVEKAQDAEKEAQKNIFLLVRRGKVSYLYQRYLAEQELTSMLLCFKHSNQDVAQVPHMVYDWISSTHGASPEKRRNQTEALFIIFTMFDTEFGIKAGQRDDSVERWSTRLDTALFSFLGKSHTWIKDWVDGRPFNNIFWLRNPSIVDKGLLDYETGGMELGFREPDRLAMLRTNFVANEDVRRHFADPGRAWDAGLALNDGGIAYIAERLGPVCNPALKRRQVTGQLVDLAGRLIGKLEPYFVSNDIDQELAKRRNEARIVGRQLLACAQAQAFGVLLRELQVTGEELGHVFRRQQLAATEAPSIINVPVGRRASSKTMADDFDAGFEDDEPVATPPPAASKQEEDEVHEANDMADVFADAAVRTWLERMNRWAAQDDVPSIFRIEKESASILVSHVFAAARRHNLRGGIAAEIRSRAAYQERLADRLVKPVIVAERNLNDFVTWLGFDKAAPDKRPQAGREKRAVFVPPAPAEDMPVLSEVPLPYDSVFYVDWATSFVRAVEDNVRGAQGLMIDVASNERLGKVLGTLRSAATA